MRSLLLATSAGTSVFSDQTRHRWELADEKIRRIGGDHAPLASGMLLRQTRRQEAFRREGLHIALMPANRQEQVAPPQDAPTSPVGLAANTAPIGAGSCTAYAGGASGIACAGARSCTACVGGGWGSTYAAAAIPEQRGRRERRPPQPLQNGNWTNSQLQGALRAHDQGFSVNGAATLFDIPMSSFCAHFIGMVLSRKRGAAPVLSPAEKDQLVQYVIGMQNLGFPLTISQLKFKVAIIT
jgi:hypothetical protein